MFATTTDQQRAELELRRREAADRYTETGSEDLVAEVAAGPLARLLVEADRNRRMVSLTLLEVRVLGELGVLDDRARVTPFGRALAALERETTYAFRAELDTHGLVKADEDAAALGVLTETPGEWRSTMSVAGLGGFASWGPMGDTGRARALPALARLRRDGLVERRDVGDGNLEWRVDEARYDELVALVLSRPARGSR